MMTAWRSDQVVDPRGLDAEDGSIQEDERAQCLVVGRCAGAVSGDVFQECGYFGPGQGARVFAAMKGDEATRPLNVRPLRPRAVPASAKLDSKTVEE
jgi:hypothetical protein